ncbi:MAG: ORF6N domain-containing protein [Opitutaceae bacterium]|jgi:hypothetical protein|nr:ORF6N domain-containing protein [Opitutaceae bacterium]
MATNAIRPKRVSNATGSPVLIAGPEIRHRIHLVRGRRVMLDADLADYFGVLTKNLNKAVDRNPDRFPEDFAFILTIAETRNLKFQNGISSLQHARSHGGARKPARVFTGQGVAMLASVLRGERAAAISIAIVRVFVQLRELISTHRDLAAKFAELERRIEGHDEAIANLFEAIRQLLAPPPAPGKKIGFHQGNR